MITLTTEHIDQIRKYFLVSDEEEQLSIQNSITPTYLSSFLPQLKHFFNDKINDDSGFLSIVKNIGAEEHLEEFKKIQVDYYAHLALFYNLGGSNPDIKSLINSGNSDFLSEIEFQKELKTAFLLEERASLKKKFQELDKEAEISPEEISLAFKLKERQKLKEQFRAMKTEGDTTLKPKGAVIHLNWRQFAVAASLTGLVLTTTYLIFNKTNDQKDTTVVSNGEIQKGADSITNGDLVRKKINDLLVAGLPVPIEKNVVILKEPSLGFAAKEEKLVIRVYDLDDNISKIDELRKEMKQQLNLDSKLDSLKAKRDSLYRRKDKYTFNNKIISIFIGSKRDIKILQIGTEYYFLIDRVGFECKRSEHLLPLKPANAQIQRRIKQIVN